MPFNFPVKISEQSPVQPLLSGVCALGEEVVATASSAISGCFSESTIQSNRHDDCPWFVTAISSLIATGAFLLEVLWDTLTDCGRFLFNLIAPLIGQPKSTGNVSQAALDATVNYRINRAKMSELPQDVAIPSNDLRRLYNVELARIPQENGGEPRLIDTVTEQYASFPERGPETMNLLKGLANYILDGLDGTRGQGPSRQKTEYEEMERMWMHIGYQLRDGNLPVVRKANIFGKLADAMQGCNPHKYKGVRRGFEISIGGTFDQKILYWLKDFKREVILQRFQGSQFHVENHAIYSVRDWGLGGDESELNDPYRNMGGAGLSGLNYRYVLNREVTPARLVEMVKTQLEAEDESEVVVTTYLQQNSDDLPDGWDGPEYNEEYHLPNRPPLMRPNHRLIAWVLGHMGFFEEVCVTL